MSELYGIPLKALWIFNCNEAEIAVDFWLEKDRRGYQVKGSGIDAFTSDGHFKVCSVENIDRNYIHKPNTTVYIKDPLVHKKVMNYWKKESGEIRYNEVLKQLEKYKKLQEKALFESPVSTVEMQTKDAEIELTQKQVYDLVFEIEALIEMQKTFRGKISNEQIEALVKVSTEGFSEDTIQRLHAELKRKEIIS